MLDNIKQFNVDRGDMEDLISLHAFGQLVKSEYESLDVELPEWLEPKLRQIKKEIFQKESDRNNKRLNDAKSRLESLKTPAEKKAALQKEIKRLEQLSKAVGE